MAGVNELYSIGDVARRTGLSVSAIRFYADEGVVAPTGLTEGGFRQYDVHAIARLELVRTLRDLGAGLDDIRRVLAARDHPARPGRHAPAAGRGPTAPVPGPPRRAADHRPATHHNGTGEPDAQARVDVRRRPRPAHHRFWDFVTDGLDVHPGYVERLRSRRPHLPEEPTTEQLEAWIELAEIVQDEQFRTALRDNLHRTFGTEQGKLMATPEMMAHAETQRRAPSGGAGGAAGRRARGFARRPGTSPSAWSPTPRRFRRRHDRDARPRQGPAQHDRLRPGRAAQTRAKLTGLNLLVQVQPRWWRRSTALPSRTRTGGGGPGMAGRRPAQGHHLTATWWPRRRSAERSGRRSRADRAETPEERTFTSSRSG